MQNKLKQCTKCLTMKNIKEGDVCARCEPNELKTFFREEYYKWQWVTHPSDDPQNFYPQRTNRAIANWWLERLKEEREEVLREERRFIVNVLDGIDMADKEAGVIGGTQAIRLALESRSLK